MRILVVHEVNYLSKIIYEFQILPEILSILGHDVTVIDYDDTWRADPQNLGTRLHTHVFHNVHRAYPQASITVRRPGMVRLPILSRISGSLSAANEIRHTMRKARPDAVLLYGIPTIGLQTHLLARNAGVPVICRSIDVTHQLVPNRFLVPPTHVLTKYVFTHAALNVALTPHLKAYIQSYGVNDSRIRLLPSGVDTQMFSPDERNGERKQEILSRWGIRATDRVILFMGTIYRFSGLDRIIREFPKLLSEHPNAKLFVVGVGEDENRLKTIAVECGVSSHVVFGGLQPYLDLPDIICAADVCINPFELNGVTENILPTKLFQYLACGKPVLATPLPGTLPFLTGEEHGIVYAELNEFVTQLSKLLSDGPRSRRLGEAGVAAVQMYGWTEIAKTLVTWMEELI